jgi:hypothetical protein
MRRFINKKQLDELVGGDIFSDGNDRNVSGETEIETGPVAKSHKDNSDYQKGISTTTDRVADRYRQNIPWFAVYSFGGSNTGGLPMNYGQISKLSEDNKTMSKQELEEIIEDLVKKKTTNDVTDKNYNPKVTKLFDMIKDYDLSDEQLEELSKVIQNKMGSKPKNKNL